MSNQEQKPHLDDAARLSALLCNYIIEGSKHLENSMWTNRSLTLAKAFVPVAVALRDAQATDLTPIAINELLSLEKLLQISFNHQGRYGESFDQVCEPLVNYLKSLSGFDAANPLQINQKLLDQHGLFAMTLHRVVGELTTFGSAKFKIDFLGKDLTALLIAYNDSLKEQVNLDHALFVDAANDEDDLFSKSDDLNDEHDLFSVSPEDSIFAKPDNPEDNALPDVSNIFAKSNQVQIDDDFNVSISKAS